MKFLLMIMRAFLSGRPITTDQMYDFYCERLN